MLLERKWVQNSASVGVNAVNDINRIQFTVHPSVRNFATKPGEKAAKIRTGGKVTDGPLT